MKKFLLSVLSVLCAVQSFSQSLGNETCSTAVTVPTNGTCVSGNNIGADAIGDGTASCFSIDNGIWFKFVAPMTGPVTITNNDPGTNFNTQLALYTGACGSLAEVVCENDNGVAAGKATISSPCLIPGQTYYVLLDGYAGATGNFCIKITTGNSPSNDNCQCPIPLPTDGSCVNGTTLNATNQWGSLVGCQSAASNVEVWYTFTATQTGMTFNLSGGASGPLTGNGEIIVAKGNSCAALTTIAGSSCGPLPLSYTISGLVIGAQYYVTISNPPANSGSFVLCGTSVIPPVVPGQDCPSASLLCTNATISQPTSNGGFGIQEVNTTNSCWGTLGGVGQGERQSKWYKFTVGCSGPLTFSIRPVNNNDDYDWAIWNTTTLGCPSLANPSQTSVACNWQGIGGAANGSTGMTSSPSTACTALGAVDYTNDPSCDPYAYVNTAAGGGTSTYTPYNAVAGQTYVMLIDNFTSTNSGFTLSWGSGVIIGPDPAFTITNPPCTRGITVAKTCTTTNSNLVWDFGDGSTLTTTSAGNQTHTYAADGTYNVTLTITDALGCVKTLTKSITVANPPVAPTAANVAICSGNTATVSATAPGGLYEWYTAATGGTLLGSEASYTSPILTANATYYVQTTVNGCTSPRTIVTVTVNPNPVATVGAAKTICNLTSTTIGAATVGTNTYSWTSNPVGFTSTSSNPTVSPNVTTVYTVVETIAATGCTASNSVTVTVTPVPVATATPSSSTICSNTATSIALTSNIAGTTFAWTVSTSAASLTGASNGSGSSIAQTLTNSSTSSQTATYTITPTAGGCAGAPITVVITVNPRPVVTATPSASTICSGTATSIALTSNLPSTTFAWTITTSGSTTGAAAGSGATIAQTITNTSTVAQTVTYNITPTASGCTGTPVAVTITINPTPVVTATPASQSFCSGGTTGIVLTSNVTSTTFSWTVTASSASLTGAAAGSGANITQTLTNTSSSAQTATYTITPSASSCPGAPITVVITVNPRPVAVATPSSDLICSGTAPNIVLTNNISGTTFTWTVSTSSGLLTGASAGSGTSISQVLTNASTSNQTATYDITPTASGCTGTPISVVITVKPTPAVTATPSPVTICSGSATSVALTSTVAGTTFAWTVSAPASVTGASAGSGSTISQTLTNTSSIVQTVTYTVTPTAAGCAGTPVAVVVTVNPRPVVTATPAAQTFCSGGTTGIALTSNVTGTTFSWTVSTSSASLTGASASSGTNITQTLTNTSTIAQTATYTITPTASSCAGTPITVTITVNPSASTAPQTYTVTFNTNGVCPSSSTFNLTITTAPSATFSYAGPYCSNGTNPIPAFPAGSSAGTFSSTAGLVFVSTTTGQINLSASTAGTYTVTNTIAAGGGCAAATATNTVTIIAAPLAPTVTTPVVYCQNATASALTATGTNLLWYTAATGGIGSATAPTPGTVTPGTTSYYVSQTVSGCEGPRAQIDVLVNPTPVASATPVTQSFCSGGTTSIALTSSVAGSAFN
ncbi:MAG: large protein, partial [Bacteroidota bacterium]|nr:large protein [Bacteroidota bacterium]